ncbi:MAG TPA: diguanylate cyclase [Trueperaceae bacterium]|nr:diguanylate cyclase [Trueperaceae bacterium]
MSRNTIILSLIVSVLLVIALDAEIAVLIGLPAAATLVAVVLLLHKPRTLPWRLATAASLLWAFEEVLWALRRAGGLETASQLTDVTYYGGAVLWAAALLLLHGRRITRTLWLPMLPALALLLLLMVRETPRILELQFPVLDAVLVLVAIPALQPATRGRASEGRMLLVLAFFLKAIGSAVLSWLYTAEGVQGALAVLWVLTFCLLALAAQVELAEENAEIFSTAAVIVGLNLAIAALAVSFYANGVLADQFALGIFILLAYCQLVAVMLILASYRQRRMVAEAELRTWGALLEGVQRYAGDMTDPPRALARLLTELQKRFPFLNGIELHQDKSFRAGGQAPYRYPIVAAGTEIGRLHFARTPIHVNLLDAVAPLLANQLHGALEQTRWINRAITDPLTGILNRRGLELRSAALVESASGRDVPVSVVMLDLDHFKRVNDYHGHEVGDRALKATAEILSSHMRADDLVVRWGGEEFVAVLVDADVGAATEIVKRVKSELRDKRLPPIAWSLTLSAGVAGGSTPLDVASISGWVFEADLALKRAKESGRDRIESIA